MFSKVSQYIYYFDFEGYERNYAIYTIGMRIRKHE